MQPESLHDWLGLIEARHGQAIHLGLDRVATVYETLGTLPDTVIITVGGTNGKGSTCAILEAILLAEGYRVGCYTSPHLLRYNERVRLNGQEADDATLVAGFAAVEAARGTTPLTYFEHGTLAAWAVFKQAAPDVIILEVGLGGRLDAVNVIDPDCAIVTGIAIDHVDFLSDDLEKIGYEKAGIFRSGKPAIYGAPQPPQRLIAHAEALEAPLWISGRDFGFGGDRQQWGYWRYTEAGTQQGPLVKRGGLAYPALRGANQLLNATAAITALETLRVRLPVSMQAIRQGLMLVELPGRFQVLPGQPTVVLDVAHNPQAAGVLSENLSNMGFYPETWAIIGMLNDKDVDGVIARMRGRVNHWLLASLSGSRGLSAEKLAERLIEAGIEQSLIHCFPDPHTAFNQAQKNAAKDDRIVVFGSFLTVTDVLVAIKEPCH